MADDNKLVVGGKRPTSGRIEALLQQFKDQAEKVYGTGVGDPTVSERVQEELPYTQKHMDMLEKPDLLERLVAYGRTIVKDADDIWRAMFLAQASCYAPPIMQGEKQHRAQAHILLVGEYSTAKSTLFSASLKMFPRSLHATDFTIPGMMGTVTKDGARKMGAAEKCDRAVMVIDEFDKLVQRKPETDHVLRIVMEEQRYRRETAYGVLSYNAHPVVFAGANPTNDVFRDELMSKQVPFKFGLVSRFDYLRPMAYTTIQINEIADFLAQNCFQEAEPPTDWNMEDTLKMYYALQSTIVQKRVRKVATTKENVQFLSKLFQQHNRIIGGVPLLSVRDFMGVLRWFNASAVMHVRQRTVTDNGILIAAEQDITNAAYMLDNVSRYRAMLLSTVTRDEVALPPQTKALRLIEAFIAEKGGNVEKQDAVEYLVVGAMGLSKTTAYEYIKQLVEGGQLKQSGLRGATLTLKDGLIEATPAILPNNWEDGQ